MMKKSLLTLTCLCFVSLLFSASSVYYRPFKDFPARLAIESLHVTATDAMYRKAESMSSSEHTQELIVLLQSIDHFFINGIYRVEAHGLINYDGELNESVFARLSSDLGLDYESTRCWMIATRLIRMSDQPEPVALAQIKADYLRMASDIHRRLVDLYGPEKFKGFCQSIHFGEIPGEAYLTTPRVYMQHASFNLVRDINKLDSLDSPILTPAIQEEAKPIKKSFVKKTFGWLPFL